VLLSLMMVKSPITDADMIRGLACRAVAGLARCPTVRQIISKLPLFTTSQIQERCSRAVYRARCPARRAPNTSARCSARTAWRGAGRGAGPSGPRPRRASRFTPSSPSTSTTSTRSARTPSSRALSSTCSS
ncbi:unnamed protein product, partial [Leptidea sinapis]